MAIFSLAYAGMGSIEVTNNIRHMLVTYIFTLYCSMLWPFPRRAKLPKRSNKSPH